MTILHNRKIEIDYQMEERIEQIEKKLDRLIGYIGTSFDQINGNIGILQAAVGKTNDNLRTVSIKVDEIKRELAKDVPDIKTGINEIKLEINKIQKVSRYEEAYNDLNKFPAN